MAHRPAASNGLIILLVALIVLLCVSATLSVHAARNGKPKSPNTKVKDKGGAIGSGGLNGDNLPVYEASLKIVEADFKPLLEKLDDARRAGSLDSDDHIVESPYGDKPPPGFNDTLVPIGTVGDLKRRRLNVFLPDTRVDVNEGVYPYRAVGYFAGCTATLVYQRGTIITNAHCLDFSSTGVFLASNWNKVFQAGVQLLGGVFTEVGRSTPQIVVYNRNSDFAVIRLVHNLDDTLGRFGVNWRQASYFNTNTALQMVSYSGDHCKSTSCVAKRSSGSTRGVESDGDIRHDLDAKRGSSGSTMYTWASGACCPVHQALNFAEYRNGGENSLTLSAYSNGNANLAKPSVVWEIAAYQVRRADVRATIQNTGKWGSYSSLGAARCPEGTLATLFSQRVERSQGSGDDTAMNSVAISCKSRTTASSSFVSTTWGNWGSWYNSNACSTVGHYAQCFRIKRESSQGTGDDTAANAIEMRCTNGQVLTAGGGGSWGYWSSWQCCPAGTAFCGVNVQFESNQGSGDDTAMNGVRFECCPTSGI